MSLRRSVQSRLFAVLWVGDGSLYLWFLFQPLDDALPRRKKTSAGVSFLVMLQWCSSPRIAHKDYWVAPAIRSGPNKWVDSLQMH
jgi:hypothetical protein